MKILIPSTPATGHINPLLAIVHILRAEDHEITFLTGSAFRDRIENSGANFVSLQGAADFDGRNLLSVAPELKDIPPGLEWFQSLSSDASSIASWRSTRACCRRWKNLRLM
jgi:Glycosyltransferase family 28 N-terminal domain